MKKDDITSKIFLFTRRLRESVQHEGFDRGSILQCRILSFIKEHDDPTMKQIAEYLRITQASGTSLINRLVRKGYLSRIHDRSDKRVVRVRMNAKGKNFLIEKYGIFSDSVRTLVGVLSAKEQSELARLMDKIISQ